MKQQDFGLLNNNIQQTHGMQRSQTCHDKLNQVTNVPNDISGNKIVIDQDQNSSGELQLGTSLNLDEPIRTNSARNLQTSPKVVEDNTQYLDDVIKSEDYIKIIEQKSINYGNAKGSSSDEKPTQITPT